MFASSEIFFFFRNKIQQHTDTLSRRFTSKKMHRYTVTSTAKNKLTRKESNALQKMTK